MNNREDLVKLLNETCSGLFGYNEILYKDIVVTYTLANGISVDTALWDDLIGDLWNNLTPAIKDSFETFEEFDNYIASDLV